MDNIEDFIFFHKIWLEFGVAVGTLGATLIALWPTIDKYCLPIRLDFRLDDKIGFVISDKNHMYKLHLGFRFLNKTNKDLIIDRIIAKIKHKDSKMQFILDWNEFIQDYFAKKVIPKIRPIPIILKPRSSYYEMIQFFVSPKEDINLKIGNWTLEINLWINKNKISDRSSFTKEFPFKVAKSHIDQISVEKKFFKKRNFIGDCPLVHIPIEDWDIQKISHSL